MIIWGKMLPIPLKMVFSLSESSHTPVLRFRVSGILPGVAVASWLVLMATLSPLIEPVKAQQGITYTERVWDTTDGFPIQRLLWASIIQTQDGYLWIGTRVGLVRFDGLRFETFTTEKASGILDNRITRMFESSDSSLWIATQYGYLVRYRDGVFEAVLSEDPDTADPSYVTSFFEMPDGVLLVGTQNGILELKGSKAEPVFREAIHQSVEDLIYDQTGTLWVSTSDGLLRHRHGTVRRYSSADGLADSHPLDLFSAKDSTVWINHPKGRISRIKDGEAARYLLPGTLASQPHYLHQDSRGRLWLSAGKTLHQYRDGSWVETPFTAQLPDLFPEWFSFGRTAVGEDLDQAWFSWEYAQLGEMISEAEAPLSNPPDLMGRHQGKAPPAILRDKEENVWLAGFHNGLVRLRPALFETEPRELLSGATNADDREAINIYALEETKDGSVWLVGLLSSLIQIRPDGLQKQYGRPSAFSFPSYAVFEDRRGILWVNGSYCVRNENAICEQFVPVMQLQGQVIRVTIEDSDGTLWFGTDNGLFSFDPDPVNWKTGRWTHYDAASGLSHTKVQSLGLTSDGALWIGTNGGGLIRMKDRSFEQFTTEHGLRSNRINALYVDERDVVWAGLEDLGLVRLSLEVRGGERSVKVVSYSTEQGLFSNGINSILEDGMSRLWMSTRRGIFWVMREELDEYAAGNSKQISSTVYRSEYGLLNPEANGGAGHTAMKDSRGRLWFGTQLGAAIVDPEDVVPNPVPPPVVVEGVTSRLEQIPIHSAQVQLSQDQRDFQISYTGLSLAAPELVRFRYRLENYDQTWKDAGTNRSASFTRVPAGRYTFHVVAANNYGVWNEEGAKITISVAPFFYETWWFRVLGIGGLVGFLFLADRLRVRTLIRRRELLEERVKERTHQLRIEKEKTESQAERLQQLDQLKRHSFENISHEYRTPLTLIMGPLQQMLAGRYGRLPEDTIPVHEMMLRHSGRLLRLTNQILDLARMDSGLSQPQMGRGDIGSLLREAVQVFTPLAERNGVRVWFENDHLQDSTPYACWIIFDRDMIMKVVANLLSNALKFTPSAGVVTVRCVEDDRYVVVEISDTGPGIPPDRLNSLFDRFGQIERSSPGQQSGTGIGLSIVKEFTEAHDGTVSVASKLGEGCRFSVSLPRDTNTRTTGTDTSVQPDVVASPFSLQNNWLELEPDLLPVSGEVDLEADAAVDRVTLLIVDDNADVRRFLRSQFEAEYRIIEAADGREGLTQANNHLPDLIIADVSMPNMDGLEFNRTLKGVPELSCVPVILLTARATIEDQIAGLATEVDEYMTKPFDPELLRARVTSLLHIRHRLRDQLIEYPSQVESDKTKVETAVFTEEVRRVILANLGNATLTVDSLAELMLISRWQLRRRLLEESGTTPNTLIRQVRLVEAAKLLEKGAGNVSEIAYAVGFESLSHFSRSFRSQFGMSPSKYVSR